MATIQKKGPFRFCAVVRRVGYPSQSRTFQSRSEAEAWATQVEAEMLNNQWKPPPVDLMTVREAFERYGKEVSPTKKGARRELVRIRQLGGEKFFELSLNKVTASVMAQWRDERLKRYAPATVMKELALVSHLFTICRKEWGMTELDNPVAHIRKPRVKNERDRRILPDEQAKLREHMPELVGKVFDFAIETAMRKSEILALKWVDIQGVKAVLRDSKNGRGRVVPLTVNARSCLDKTLDAERVFPITSNALDHYFKDARKKAGIEDVRFHDTRHEATSRLFEKGLTMMQVSKITGHRSVELLHRYTHLQDDDLIAALG